MPLSRGKGQRTRGRQRLLKISRAMVEKKVKTLARSKDQTRVYGRQQVLCAASKGSAPQGLFPRLLTALQGTGQGGSLDHHCLLELDRLGIPIWGSELVALCLEPLTTFLSLDFSLGERGPEQLYQGSLRASLRWCSGGSQQSTGGSVSP